MVEPIEPITAVKKKKASFEAYMPLMQPSFTWAGEIVPFTFLKIIVDGNSRVGNAAISKACEVRQDHDRETHKVHFKRFLSEVDLQRKVFKRDFVIIPFS